MKAKKNHDKFRRFSPVFLLLGGAAFFVLFPAVFLGGPYFIPASVLLAAAGLFLFFGCEKILLYRLCLNLQTGNSYDDRLCYPPPRGTARRGNREMSNTMGINALSLAPVPPGDPWRLDFFLKKAEPSFPVSLHLIKTPFPLSFCFGGRSSSCIVFSEKLLETLSEGERELMIFWYVRAGDEGRIFFLTVLSVILRGLNGFFSFVSFPRRLFRKKPQMNVVSRWILRGLGWFLRGLFFHIDKMTAKGHSPRKSALTLWKMQSLYEAEPCPLPFFFAPLFFADPLSAPESPAVPLQPDKGQRVRSLIGTYPP